MTTKKELSSSFVENCSRKRLDPFYDVFQGYARKFLNHMGKKRKKQIRGFLLPQWNLQFGFIVLPGFVKWFFQISFGSLQISFEKGVQWKQDHIVQTIHLNGEKKAKDNSTLSTSFLFLKPYDLLNAHEQNQKQEYLKNSLSKHLYQILMLLS